MNARYLLIVALAGLAGCGEPEDKEKAPLRKGEFVAVGPMVRVTPPENNVEKEPAKNDNAAPMKKPAPLEKKSKQPAPLKAAPQDEGSIKSMDERPPLTEHTYREKFGEGPPRIIFSRPEQRFYKYLEGHRLFWNQRAGAWNPGDPD